MVSLATRVCVFHFVRFDIEKIAFLKDGFLSPIGQLRSFGISLPRSFTPLFLLVTCDFGSRTLKTDGASQIMLMFPVFLALVVMIYVQINACLLLQNIGFAVWLLCACAAA